MSVVPFIGCAVRRRRRLLGLTQRQLSVRAKTKRPLVSRVERGIHVVSLDTLERYAIALEMRASELLRAAEELAESAAATAAAATPVTRRGQVWI